MKKKLCVLLVVTLLLSLGLTACGGGGSTPHNYILATGGVSGTYYPYGGAMAELWNANLTDLSVNVTAQSTGASAENLKLIAQGEVDLAIVQNDVMDYAFNGTELFADSGKLEGYSAIATLYPEVVQIVVRPGIGVETIADLKGKKVSIGDAGSGVEANAIQILGAYGLTRDDIVARNLSFKESGSTYQDGQLDAFFVTAGLPNAAIQEICATTDINIISIEGAELEKLLTDYPYYTTYNIPKDTYKGMTKDATALSIKASLIVSDNLDEEMVYQLTKALFENKDSFAHAKAAELSLDTAQDGISIPLHPGAEKYYKEAGK